MSALKPVTLASTSAVRRAILDGAGVRYEAVSPGVDEDAVKRELAGATPEALALELARRKALAVSAGRSGLVMGADQVLTFDGRMFDKAADMKEAETRLKQWRGHPHALIGGVALAEGGRVVWEHCETSRLVMREFSDAFLARYLRDAGPRILSSVGCYQLEGLGAQLFAHIDGDYFAVLGLPLLPLLDALRAHGGLQQ